MIQSSPVTAMFYRAATEPKRSRMHRARPVAALAAVSFAIGVITAVDTGGSPAGSTARDFVAAWARGDYASMYRAVDASTQHRLSPARFAAAYRSDLRTATATRVRVAGRARGLGHGIVEVPVRVYTRLFGTLALAFRVPVASSEGHHVIAWSSSLAFPGLQPRERLERDTALPPRARILARDGSVLAEGSPTGAGQRSSPLGAAATAVLGEVGPVPSSRAAGLEAQGIPRDAIVGVSGLERTLDARLRGVPGGRLLAEPAGEPARARVLAFAPSRPAPAVRTTISPGLQHAAVAALGSQLGGVVALDPSNGEVLAVAGIGLDSLQPPGSTFKIVTLTAVLQSGVAHPSSVFPYATHATLDGVELSNANGETCGGSLEHAFAESCNSVFAPLGVKVGAARLVATAESFGFNHPPGIEGASESTIPPASRIQGELDLGSTAIGQGQVQASALQMAIAASTIADGGRRPKPTFLPAAHTAPPARVIPVGVAHTVRRLMTEVVRSGTGTAAAIPGVVVAGKTGTAELKTQSQCGASAETASSSGEAEGSGESCRGAASNPENTDAWFAAFAPALHPRFAVGVMLVKDGAGGATAAPVAREVLETGLRGS